MTVSWTASLAPQRQQHERDEQGSPMAYPQSWFYYSADTPSVSLLERLLEWERVQQKGGAGVG